MKKILHCALPVAVLFATSLSPMAQAEGVDPTLNSPTLQATPWVNVWFGGVTQTDIQAVIGVEQKVNGELPCKIPGPHSVACAMPGSYYKVEVIDRGNISFPHGIFIDNINNGYVHNWAQKMSRVDIEIWPKRDGLDDMQVGAVRFDTADFTNQANGGRYTPNIGKVTLPTMNAGSPYLNGFVKENGTSVPVGRFEIIGFQKSNLPLSTTGFPYQGLFDKGLIADGYYHSGPILSGLYDLTLVDHVRNVTVLGWLDLNRPGERVDFNLEAKCFGLPADRCISDSRYRE